MIQAIVLVKSTKAVHLHSQIFGGYFEADEAIEKNPAYEMLGVYWPLESKVSWNRDIQAILTDDAKRGGLPNMERVITAYLESKKEPK